MASAGKFILRYPFFRQLMRGRAAEDGGQSPEILVAVDLAEVFFGEQPGRGHPALDHVGVTPTRDVVGSACVRRQLFLWVDDNYFSRSTTITL